MKTMIELFCGTQNMAKAFRQAGYKTLTIDINKDLKPDLAMDILDLKIKDLPKEFQDPDVIWASPPCNSFSVLTIGRYWDAVNKPKHYRAFIGMAMVMQVLQLIKELKPKFWFIENPRGMLRKVFFMENLPRKTVTYCQYGLKHRKPTDIWTNNTGWIPQMCNVLDTCHEAVARGDNHKGICGIQRISNWDGTGSIQRSELPPLLCLDIVMACENKCKVKQVSLFDHL